MIVVNGDGVQAIQHAQETKQMETHTHIRLTMNSEIDNFVEILVRVRYPSIYVRRRENLYAQLTLTQLGDGEENRQEEIK